MIIARAPARISFGGGGTDLAAYYERFGGLVVSTAITRYCTVTARPTPDGSIRMRSRGFPQERRFDRGVCPSVDCDLQLPAAVIERYFNEGLCEQGVEVVISSDVPHGSGLGSSSTVTVALVIALAAYCGQRLSADEAAGIACEVEIDRLGMPIGRQDQHASAFGGLNVIEFNRYQTTVSPMALSEDLMADLDLRLLLFSTGKTRQAADILRQQRSDTGSNASVVESLHRIKELTVKMIDALQDGNLDRFGRLLDTGWQEKKRLSNRISSTEIDRCYAAARDAGALGGKISGAGGGGFLLLYCLPAAQPRLRDTMSNMGLSELRFGFDTTGATLLSSYSPEPDAAIVHEAVHLN